jgi:hypothetical protein
MHAQKVSVVGAVIGAPVGRRSPATLRSTDVDYSGEARLGRATVAALALGPARTRWSGTGRPDGPRRMSVRHCAGTLSWSPGQCRRCDGVRRPHGWLAGLTNQSVGFVDNGVGRQHSAALLGDNPPRSGGASGQPEPAVGGRRAAAFLFPAPSFAPLQLAARRPGAAHGGRGAAAAVTPTGVRVCVPGEVALAADRVDGAADRWRW